jgi:hypothetical protein
MVEVSDCQCQNRNGLILASSAQGNLRSWSEAVINKVILKNNPHKTEKKEKSSPTERARDNREVPGNKTTKEKNKKAR